MTVFVVPCPYRLCFNYSFGVGCTDMMDIKDTVFSLQYYEGASDNFICYLPWYNGEKWHIFCFLHCYGEEYWQFCFYLALKWWGLMTLSFLRCNDMKGNINHFVLPYNARNVFNDKFFCSLHWYDGD